MMTHECNSFSREATLSAGVRAQRCFAAKQESAAPLHENDHD
jgi:hypothetical protein